MLSVVTVGERDTRPQDVWHRDAAQRMSGVGWEWVQQRGAGRSYGEGRVGDHRGRITACALWGQ